MSTLPTKAKVVIIGGGIHGLSTAWKLSETYKNPGDIVILEKKRYCSRSKWNCMWCYKKQLFPASHEGINGSFCCCMGK